MADVRWYDAGAAGGADRRAATAARAGRLSLGCRAVENDRTSHRGRRAARAGGSG